MKTKLISHCLRYISISALMLNVNVCFSSIPENREIVISENKLQLSFTLLGNNELKFRTLMPLNISNNYKLPEMKGDSDNETFIHLSGLDRGIHHGAKLTGGNPGMRLKFVEKKEYKTSKGKQIIIVQTDSITSLRLESVYEFYDSIPVIRRYTKVFNNGTQPVNIEYVSSAILNNFTNLTTGNAQKSILIHYAFNSWQQEAQWKCASPSNLGWENNDAFNINNVSFSNMGSWSTIKYLPMGMIENIPMGVIWFWQIEHNGSWHTEMSNTSNGSTYLYLGGPDAEHSAALKTLLPGKSYETVPIALGCVTGGFNEAVAALTKYRRKALVTTKPSDANCPVIFNDYMNCLWANPTTENELPLINAAAKVGCDFYIIDAGWYSEKNEGWWHSVGAWQPSKTRFVPNGLISIIDTIRSKGMKPGLWLEPEVAGINSPLKNKPDNWFLLRSGKRIIDNGRFLLDFRNAQVREYMTLVVNRMVTEYGAQYIKMDYNNSAWGAETEGTTDGQGLLEHNRAVVAWFKEIAQKYPELIIENCGSGGLRMDYAMLANTQIQSSSDQSNYKKFPSIIVGAMAAVVPEQIAAWSYPRANCDSTEATFNMVTAMLCRICQSGNLDKIDAASFAQVKNALSIYKSKLAPFIPNAVPFFPFSMPSMNDTISAVAVGIKNNKTEYIAVWRLAGQSDIYIPGKNYKNVSLLYPQNMHITYKETLGGIQISFPNKYMAAIIEINKR